MNKEDKNLLLKDLCARLPYHVRVKVWLKYGLTEEGFLDLEHNYSDVLRDAFYYNEIKKIKPYLRPLSSMTEEEKNIFYSFMEKDNYGFPTDVINKEKIHEYINWLLANHFDFNGLIPKGLAIAITKENNLYK